MFRNAPPGRADPPRGDGFPLDFARRLPVRPCGSRAIIEYDGHITSRIPSCACRVIESSRVGSDRSGNRKPPVSQSDRRSRNESCKVNFCPKRFLRDETGASDAEFQIWARRPFSTRVDGGERDRGLAGPRRLRPDLPALLLENRSPLRIGTRTGTRTIRMTHAPGREQPRQHGWPVGRVPFDSPAGMRLIVPGWPQFYWGQRERGWVLFGSFVVVRAGLLTWGTWVAWSFFAFAFLTHITSMTDSIRQGSFPVYPRRTVPLLITSALAVSCYLPLLSALFFTACPEFSPDRTGDVYLVNCLAYRSDRPRCGHWVWLRRPSAGHCSHPARVVAVAGQEVEWNGHHWLIDGKNQPLNELHRNTVWPLPCHFKIPADQLLVEPEEKVPTRHDGEPALPGRTRSDHGPGLGPDIIPSGIVGCSEGIGGGGAGSRLPGPEPCSG